MTDQEQLEKLYNLKANPFSQRANPDAPIVGRAKERQTWANILDSTIGQRGSSLNFIQGDYGLGKTHSLYQIQKLCNLRDDVTSVFMKLLLEDSAKSFGQDFIRRIFKNLPEDAMRKLATAEPKGIPPKREAHFDAIRKFAAGTAPYYEALAEGSIGAAALRKAKMPSPKTAEVITEYLAALLVMLNSVGIRSLVLLVDEAEYMFSQLNAKKSALVLNTVRAIYDIPDTPNLGLHLDSANIIFFFGLSTSGANALERMEKIEAHVGGPIKPLLSRVSTTIGLTFLDEAETKDLVAEYLHTDRATKSRKKKPLIPYDDGFVKFVYELTDGHPRKIIERCDYVLQQGLRDGVGTLTRKYAERVLDGLNLGTV